jgi:hypothetical protein
MRSKWFQVNLTGDGGHSEWQEATIVLMKPDPLTHSRKYEVRRIAYIYSHTRIAYIYSHTRIASCIATHA